MRGSGDLSSSGCVAGGIVCADPSCDSWSGADPSSVGGPDPPCVGGADPPCVGGADPPCVGGADPPCVGGAEPPCVGGAEPPCVGGADPPCVGGADPPCVGWSCVGAACAAAPRLRFAPLPTDAALEPTLGSGGAEALAVVVAAAVTTAAAELARRVLCLVMADIPGRQRDAARRA